MSSDEVAAELADLALDQGPQGVEYRPLKGSEIRLLSVAPGRWDDQVSCTLHYEPLDEEPEYVALSYTWGDPNDQVEILLDGRPHRATRSLFTALRRFRQLCNEERSYDGDFTFFFYPEGSMYIWADALCINQADNVEKMREIPRMREVYTYCMRVCAWLGENDDEIRDGDGEGAVSLEEIAEWLGSGTFGEDIPRDILDLEYEKNVEMQKTVREHFGARTDAFLDQWCRLATRPWFGRVWVIQEVALPEAEPTLVAGGILFGFERFARPSPVIENMQLSRLSQPGTYHLVALGALISSRVQTQDYQIQIEGEPEHRGATFGRALGKVLLRTGRHAFAATKSHDYLYSMIGLCGGSEFLPPELAPDYEKPFLQVYEDYARCIIKATGSVAILGRRNNFLFMDYAGHMDPFSRHVNRPLWVPDFRSSQERINVCNDADPSNVSFVGERFIRVRGFAVGTVVSGHKPLPPLYEEGAPDPSFREQLGHHHKFLERVARTGDARVEDAVSDWLTTRLLWADRGSWTKLPKVEELKELYYHFLDEKEDEHGDFRTGSFGETVNMFVQLAQWRLQSEICALCENGTVAVMHGTGAGDEPFPKDQVVALSGCGEPFYLRPVLMPDGIKAYATLGLCRSYDGPEELEYNSSDFSLEEWDESDFAHYLLM